MCMMSELWKRFTIIAVAPLRCEPYSCATDLVETGAAPLLFSNSTDFHQTL